MRGTGRSSARIVLNMITHYYYLSRIKDKSFGWRAIAGANSKWHLLSR